MKTKFKQKHVVTIFMLLTLIPLTVYQFVLARKNPLEVTASQDLDAIHAILINDHPGYVDGQNPQFKQLVEEGYATAKNKIKLIQNENDYKWVLSPYVTQFKDGHLTIHFLLPEKNQPYPGFIVRYRNKQFIVADSDQPETFPVGSELIDCDGVPIKKIMLKTVFPLRGGNPALEASWYTATPYLLQGMLASWETPYQHCHIRYEDKESTVKLTYSMISEGALQEHVHNLTKKPASFDLSYPNKHMAWIRLPTFYPHTDIQLQAIRQVIKNAPTVRMLNYVVFDLRGNQGGDSSWGVELLSTIYGSKYIDSLLHQINKDTFVEWRASKNNINYLKNHVLPYLKKEHGTTSEGYQNISQIVPKMDYAIKHHQPYVTDNEALTHPIVIPPATSDVIPLFITDGYCGSACLDFLDLGLTLPHAIQIGLATNADTDYLDIESQLLPSGLAKLSFAMKVYRQRGRGSNMPYQPTVRYTDDMDDDTALKNWVIKNMHSF